MNVMNYKWFYDSRSSSFTHNPCAWLPLIGMLYEYNIDSIMNMNNNIDIDYFFVKNLLYAYDYPILDDFTKQFLCNSVLH